MVGPHVGAIGRYSRRGFLVAVAGVGLTTPACARTAATLVVYKSPSCGCCGAWVEHMRQAGFADIEIVNQDDLNSIRQSYGVRNEYASCHTGVIGGYALEGHVPAADVRRLLKSRPAAVGLAVPAMPLGSPGMEMPDGSKEPFDTLLMMRDGTARVFARHA